MRSINIFLLLVTGTVFYSCNQKHSSQQTQSGNIAASAFSWQVKGCAEKAIRSKADITPDSFRSFPESAEPGLPLLHVAGDSLLYTREVSHLCCREVTVSARQQQSLITITEYWFRPGCKCKCSSTVSAVMRQLPAGEYQVIVVETGTDPLHDQPTNAVDTLLNRKITVQ